mgnify:CR=1 FL=1
MIDPRAVIDPSAVIAEGVDIGPWSMVGAGVEIGEGTVIGPHVIIKGPTKIGKNNKIFQFSWRLVFMFNGKLHSTLQKPGIHSHVLWLLSFPLAVEWEIGLSPHATNCPNEVG